MIANQDSDAEITNSAAVSEYLVFEQKLGGADKAKLLQSQQEAFFGLTMKARNEIFGRRYLRAEAVFARAKPLAAYKMLAHRHYQAFFEMGTMRLGSVAEYQRTELAGRTDHLEGAFILLGESSAKSISSVVSIGRHVLAYCMTLDKRVKFADCDTGFQVINLPAFVRAVTQAINQHFVPTGNAVTRVLSGVCHYRHSRVITGPLANSATDAPSRIDAATVDVVDDAKYFLKPGDNAPETEFRIIWVLQKDVEDGAVILNCPDAREFCRDIRR